MGNTLFYVLRLILRVGTLQAQYSECVPSHSFTPNFLRIQKHNWPYKITRACVCAWIIRQSSDAAFVRKYCVFAHKFLRNYQTWSCRPQRPRSGASQAQSLTRQNGLATKNSLGSLGLPAFFLLNQTHEVWFSFTQYPRFCFGYLCGSSPMKKTVFDLLHSLDIKIQYIQ